MKPILVISVSSGENELDKSLESIRAQEGVEFDLKEIRDLGNVEAHELLYSTIMSNSEYYSYSVKVDGDMVFARKTSLSEMINLMQNDVDTDHGVFSVLDWYSQKAIMGMHVFSSRCTWTRRDHLFTDSNTIFPGSRMLVWGSPSPVAHHSPNPSLMQAFQFGFHRCLKILQRDRFCPKVSQSQFQFNLLKNVYEQYQISGDLRRKAALYGACEAANRRSAKNFVSRDDFSAYESVVSEIYLSNGMSDVECEVDLSIERVWGTGLLKKNLVYNQLLFGSWLRSNLCSVFSNVRRVVRFGKS